MKRLIENWLVLYFQSERVEQKIFVLITYHLVEARGVLETVSDIHQRTFFVILMGSDVVQLDCQFLYVGPKMFYCFQSVPKVTKYEKVRIPFISPARKGDNGSFVRNGFLIVRDCISWKCCV